MNMAALIEELRLCSPSAARFRNMRKIVSFHGGPMSMDALNQTTALLVLADTLASDEENA
jgi:hypothetical protein